MLQRPVDLAVSGLDHEAMPGVSVDGLACAVAPVQAIESTDAFAVHEPAHAAATP